MLWEMEIAKLNECKIRSSKSSKYKNENPTGATPSDFGSCISMISNFECCICSFSLFPLLVPEGKRRVNPRRSASRKVARQA